MRKLLVDFEPIQLASTRIKSLQQKPLNQCDPEFPGNYHKLQEAIREEITNRGFRNQALALLDDVRDQAELLKERATIEGEREEILLITHQLTQIRKRLTSKATGKMDSLQTIEGLQLSRAGGSQVKKLRTSLVRLSRLQNERDTQSAESIKYEGSVSLDQAIGYIAYVGLKLIAGLRNFSQEAHTAAGQPIKGIEPQTIDVPYTTIGENTQEDTELNLVIPSINQPLNASNDPNTSDNHQQEENQSTLFIKSVGELCDYLSSLREFAITGSQLRDFIPVKHLAKSTNEPLNKE